jgi:signal peptidase I
MDRILNGILLAAAIAGAVLTYYGVISIELFMLLLLLVSGIVALLDRVRLRAKRKEGEPEPQWVEYSKSFFPVILAVFLLRSFVVEPFKIPSGSMIPTLQVGDYILVNKFTLGVRLPVLNVKVLDVNEPQRGDVMVFRYPEDTSQNFIKRVVGLPGDLVEYRDKKLFINGVVQQQAREGEYNYPDDKRGTLVHTQRYQENLGGHAHPVLVMDDTPPLNVMSVRNFPGRDNCTYTEKSFSCKVPPGNYFMMGDNRDNSSDSRYWGFVPDKLIVGKAFAIWMNWGEMKRIGSTIN